MEYVLQLALFVGILYWMGRIINRCQSNRCAVHFLKVTLSFLVMLVTAAVSLAVSFVLSLGLELAIETLTQTDRLPGADQADPAGFFLFIFITIFLAGIIQFYFRRFMTSRKLIWKLSPDDVEIAEYLVQWSTILLAVYQFVFDNLREVINLGREADPTRELLELFFSPQHLNLALQPLLIAMWIAIVIEKLSTRRHLHTLGEGGADEISVE